MNKLFDLFVGEFVEIMLDQEVTLQSMSEEGVVNKTKPIVATGYLLDVDDEYLYLGDTPDEVTSVLQKFKAVEIAMARQHDKYDDVLDSFDTTGESEN